MRRSSLEHAVVPVVWKTRGHMRPNGCLYHVDLSRLLAGEEVGLGGGQSGRQCPGTLVSRDQSGVPRVSEMFNLPCGVTCSVCFVDVLGIYRSEPGTTKLRKNRRSSFCSFLVFRVSFIFRFCLSVSCFVLSFKGRIYRVGRCRSPSKVVFMDSARWGVQSDRNFSCGTLMLSMLWVPLLLYFLC